MERFLDRTRPGALSGPVPREAVYTDLQFPLGVDLPAPRPYTAVNMVSTIDGKVVIGGPDTTRLIGSATDHYLMVRIEAQADAVLLGAGIIREDNPGYPRVTGAMREKRAARGLRPDPLWIVISRRGEFSGTPKAFSGGPDTSLLVLSETPDASRRAILEQQTRVAVLPGPAVDALAMGRFLREEYGIKRMVCLGGPMLNATLLEAGAVDELFLTLAPKLQGGQRHATLVEGRGFAPETLPELDLLSLYGDGDELYLRYRLPSRAPGT